MEKDAPTNGHKAPRIGDKAPDKGHNGNGKAAIPSHFASKLVSAVPHSRKGKHNLIVSMILDDLDELEAERAIQVPLENLDGEKMENVRSALNRATRQRNMVVATATDEKYFYIWRSEAKSELKTEPAAAPLNAGARNSQR
ncbi:MAG TPA: hypothetical protein VGJ30_18515 [Candidatus Angelobacter sp.]